MWPVTMGPLQKHSPSVTLVIYIGGRKRGRKKDFIVPVKNDSVT